MLLNHLCHSQALHKVLVLALLAAGGILAGCNKNMHPAEPAATDEILFTTKRMLPVTLSTKATEETNESLGAIYVGATTGALGDTESSVWDNYQFTKSGEGIFAGISGGKW